MHPSITKALHKHADVYTYIYMYPPFPRNPKMRRGENQISAVSLIFMSSLVSPTLAISKTSLVSQLVGKLFPYIHILLDATCYSNIETYLLQKEG